MATTQLGAPLRVGDAQGGSYPDYGALTSPYFTYSVVPIALDADGICAAQAIAAAGNATINGALASGGVVALDVPRAVSVVSANAGDTTQTVTISGTDVYGVPMTQTLTLNGTTTASGAKAFSRVTRVAVSAALAGNLTVGSTDVLGLPYFLRDRGAVVKVGWNNALAQDAGTLVEGVSLAPSATTGDVRGTYRPSGATDGARRLVLTMFIENVDLLNHTTTTGTSLYGRVQA
jgi:hypothetical protein